MEIKGIDISYHNGDFDLAKAKNDGYNFAIIRAGYTGYGDGVSKAKDIQFENNYNKAKAIGLPVGIFYFTIATDYQKGVDEANWLYENCLKGKQFEYPIIIDVEDDTGNKKYLRKAGKDKTTDGIIGFCETLENKGYYVGIYGSDISTFKDMVNIDRLKDYDKWVARYGSKPQFVKEYGMWQYSDDNNLDKDIAYKDYPSIMKSKGLNGFAKESNSAPQPIRKSNEEIANEVIAGKWGNGQDRKNNLAAAGYDYNAIQTIVNNKLGVTNKPQNNELWVTVQRGDTLWGLASKYYGNGSQYRAIKNLNGLSSDLIRAGQRLRIK